MSCGGPRPDRMYFANLLTRVSACGVRGLCARVLQCGVTIFLRCFSLHTTTEPLYTDPSGALPPGGGGTGHLGRTETQRGRLWTACGQRCVDSKSSQRTPATTSTSSIRQLLGATDAQTAHPATFSTAPIRQLLGSANAETTPAGAPAAAADRTQRPDATCEGKNG